MDEPFVIVNTVTGDMGIKQAQDEYQRLNYREHAGTDRRGVRIQLHFNF